MKSVIDNSGLLNLDGRLNGYSNPNITYTYDGNNVIIDFSNISNFYGAGADRWLRMKVKVHDCFGQWIADQVNYSGGKGYKVTDTVVFTGGGGTGAAATLVVDKFGTITGVTITNAGSGYTSAPTVTITSATGSNAGLVATTDGDTITDIQIVASENIGTALDLDISSLDNSKPLAITVLIQTVKGIVADGGAYGIGAAGSIGNWDLQSNASQEIAGANTDVSVPT